MNNSYLTSLVPFQQDTPLAQSFPADARYVPPSQTSSFFGRAISFKQLQTPLPSAGNSSLVAYPFGLQAAYQPGEALTDLKTINATVNAHDSSRASQPKRLRLEDGALLGTGSSSTPAPVDTTILEDLPDILEDLPNILEGLSATVTVPCLTLTELFNSLDTENHPSVAQRLRTLFSAFSPTVLQLDGSQSRSLWIDVGSALANSSLNEIPEVWLYVVIDQRAYDSHCFTEENQSNTAEAALGDKHFFISAYENSASNEPDVSTPSFQIRLSPHMQNAEILHIGKCPQIPGHVMKKVCMSLLNYLQPEMVYLADDAKIKLDNNLSIPLRVLLPIVSERPRTWYSDEGFTLLPIVAPAPLKPDGMPLIPQCQLQYNASIQTIRETVIANLPLSTTYRKAIQRIVNKYDLSTYTVHELCRAVYAAFKDPAHPRHNSSKADLFNLFQILLKQKIHKRRELTDTDYDRCIDTLHHYQIWTRSYGSYGSNFNNIRLFQFDTPAALL